MVPVRALEEVERVGGESGSDQVEMAVTEKGNQVIFSFDEIEIVTRLLEGEFPPFEKIIPKEEKVRVVMDKEEFLAAVRMATIFARESANIVRLKIEKGKVEVTANAPEVGENRVEVEAEVKGEEEKIAFNSRYLLDFLGCVRTERVEMKMTGSLAPGVFGEEGKEEFLHIIMPVRVQE